MSKQSRRELLASVAPRYALADRPHKTRILDAFVADTGYQRKYAIHLLASWRQRPATKPAGPGRRPRARRYGPEAQRALAALWEAADHPCAKRLVPLLPVLLPALERFGEIMLAPGIREKLLDISPATADRLLQKARAACPRGRSLTKPGTLLKHQIPIRTFADWDDARPGFLEIDLVAHCADDGGGDFLYTLTMTEVLLG